MVDPQNWERGMVCMWGWGQAQICPPAHPDPESSEELPSAHLDTVNMGLDVAPRFQVQHVNQG